MRRNNFVGFEDARRLIKGLKLKGYNYWNNNETVHNFILENKIPANPCSYYSAKGWSGWADFLGTGNKVGAQTKYNANHDFFKT